MKMQNMIIMGAAVLALAVTLPARAAGDAAAGQKKIAMCQGCHGVQGYRTAFPSVYHVPKIGGQNADYLVKALQAYKSGQRSHPTMKAIAADLSEQDIANIAAYYAAENLRNAGK